MFPYLLLIFVPLLFAFVSPRATVEKGRRRWSLAIGTKPDIVSQSLMLPAFFVCFFLLLILRDETIGTDLSAYERYFLLARYGESMGTSDPSLYQQFFDEYAGYAGKSFTELFDLTRDPLYWLLTWVVARFTGNFRWFIVIISAIILIPIAKVYCKEREHGYLKLLLFVNLPTFVMVFSGLRQAVAISFGLLAYEYVREKKWIQFLLVALLAFGFHHTGFIIFLFYPLYHLPLKRKYLWVAIGGIGLTFVFNKPIFTWATDLLNRIFGEDYNTTIQETGAYTMLILFVLFAIFAYVLPDEQKMDQDALGLRNFLLMAVFLQCFAPLHTLAMRMNYYFVLFIPLLIPKILKYAKSNLKGLADIAKWVMTAFFLVYFLVEVYTACQTGISALGTYPYVPFWR